MGELCRLGTAAGVVAGFFAAAAAKHSEFESSCPTNTVLLSESNSYWFHNSLHLAFQAPKIKTNVALSAAKSSRWALGNSTRVLGSSL